jgi:outer membrane biosynthesis protein TonB
MSASLPTYVVTTSVRGKSEKSRTLIWNSSEPLTLGTPLKWVLERTEKGVRVREISPALHVVAEGKHQEFTHEMLATGAQVEMERMHFKLKSARPLKPVFGNTAGDQLSAFVCAGNWILDSRSIGDSYKAVANKKVIFTLRRDNENQPYSLQCKIAGLQAGTHGELKVDQVIPLTSENLRKLELKHSDRIWRFGSGQLTAALDTQSPGQARPIIRDEDTEFFKKALKGSVIALAALLVMTWLWPKPKEVDQELIPAQYAKILMPTTEKAESAPAAKTGVAQSETTPQKVVPKKVQEAAVVQAFRAKALQNAVSGLLKGGMTQLLAQSDFVEGKEASKDARRIFDSKVDSLKPTGFETGLTADKNVKVATIGGQDGAGPGAKGVGYSKGEHAAVQGQGHSFVAMDIPGASVEEGLTKDEVGEVIHRHMSEIRYCYESSLLRTPDIEGKLIVDFTIGGPGNVKSSEVKSSTLPDPRLDDCIIRRLVTWKFPNTKGGIDVAVSYPFIFKTLGR